MISQKKCFAANVKKNKFKLVDDAVTSPSVAQAAACPGGQGIDESFSPSEETPLSNTGSECENVGQDFNSPVLEGWIDYFQGTGKFPNLESFQQCAEFIIQMSHSGMPVVWQPGVSRYCGIHWDNSFSSPTGVLGYYNVDAESGRVHAYFSMPGGYFHLMDAIDHWRLIRGLRHAYGLKCNRIDVKVRDYTRRITPQEIIQHAVDGNVALVRSYELAGNGQIGSQACVTAYLGSRKSEKFLRIYDAMPVHGIDAIDWELQCRDEKAQIVYATLANIEIDDAETGYYNADLSHQLVGTTIGALICGSVSFVHRDEEESCSKKRLSLCPKMDWWQRFCDDCGGCLRLPSGRTPRCLDKTLDWLEKQVFPIVSALQDGFGAMDFKVWLQSRLDSAKRRHKPYHESIKWMCRNIYNDVKDSTSWDDRTVTV